MNQIMWRMLLVLAAVCMAFENTRADQLRFESCEKRVALVELFTSEGCTSCPPAERTFSKLATNPALWKTFVPIALHVNYWDNLGWKDRPDDAVVHDEEKEFRGKRMIEDWIAKTIEKYKFQFRPVTFREDNAEVIIAMEVSGTFDGSPITLDYRFIAADEKITSLTVD